MMVTKCARIVSYVVVWVFVEHLFGHGVGRRVGKTIIPKGDTDAARDARYLPAINSRAQFNSISRTYNPDLLHPLPHVLFVIDRQEQNKILLCQCQSLQSA